MHPLVDKAQQYTDFFNAWRAFSRFQPLEDRLPTFFFQLQGVLPEKINDSYSKYVSGQNLNTEAMLGFFGELAQPIKLAKRAGFFCDPWAVAGLKRDEVRNSAVLAWWLDPHGSHGFGDAFLSLLLQEIDVKKHLGLPRSTSPHCRIRVESCPDGDRASRVDIEIDDAKFFIIIEVKIDAPESNDQLKRYCDIAKVRRGTRPWAIFYLTPQGRKSKYIDNVSGYSIMNEEPIIPISWKKISAMLKIVSKQHRAHFRDNNFPELALTNLLAYSFSKHISQF
jgi:hypothetical protein